MKTKKVIIFDFDGVIIDSVALMHELSKQSFPGISDEEAKNLHTENIYESMKKFAHLKREEADEEKEARRLEYTQKKLSLALFAGMKAALSQLAKENIVVLNTSAVERNTLPILELHGIHEYFSFIGSADVHKSKIEKFKMISEKFETPLSELTFVTDTIGDLREAQEVGMPTIIVTWGIHTKEDFQDVPQSNVVAFVDTPAELLQVLES